MKRSLLPIAIALSLLSPAGVHPARAGTAESAAVKWQAWNSGLKAAGKNGRPVLVDVYTDWCGWCRRMERDVYARPDVRSYLSQRFVTVKLDAEASDEVQYEGRDYTSASLANRFRVTGYPTTIFLKSDGQHLANVPGYVAPERFLLLLRYIGEGAVDRGQSFDEFVKSAAAR